MRFHGLFLFAILGAALAPAFTVSAVSAEETVSLPDARLDAFYREHPEWMTRPGGGYKPYQRARWFMESRQGPAGVSTGRLRAEARAEGMQRAARERGATPAWFSTGPHTLSGRCTSIAFDPTDVSIVYVGTAGGGVWKSTDGGDHWAPRSDDVASLSVGAIAVLPWNGQIVLSGSGDGNYVGFGGAGLDPFGVGMLRSTDAGVTWLPTSLQYPESGTHGFSVIVANPLTGTILAGANDGLWRSTDDGATWAHPVLNGNITDIVWKPGDANRVYIAKCNDLVSTVPGAGIHVSTNDGLSFSRVGTGQPAATLYGQTRLATTAANPNCVYANIVDFTTFGTLGFYRSTDNGATWQLRQNAINMTNAQGWFDLSLAADPNDAETVVSGGVNLFRSTNGGVDFVQVNSPFNVEGTETSPHVDHHALVYEPGSNSNLWLGCDGGMWRSTNDGDNWNSQREGLVTYQFYDVCVAQGPGYFTMGGAQDNGTVGRSDLTTWFGPVVVGDGAICNIHPTNPNVIYAQNQFSNHRKSLNGGLNWQVINQGIPQSMTGQFIAPQDEDPFVGNHLYTGAATGIYRTTNGGNLWENVAPQDARSIAFSRVDGNTIWTTSNVAGTWITTNDGNAWALSSSFPASGFETQIRTHPTDGATAFVTFGGYSTGLPKLVRTTDFGASWADVGGDLPDIPVSTFVADPADGDSWFVGTDAGVWRSTDEGASWTPFGTDLPNIIVVDLEIRSDGAAPPGRKLVAATFGRAIWEIDLPSTAVGAPEIAMTPASSLMLDAPFPNPATREATFRWAARGTSPATLEVVDVSGRRVATVVAKGAADGNIRTAFWVTDDVGNGVYFAVLRAGAASTTRRVIVAK